MSASTTLGRKRVEFSARELGSIAHVGERPLPHFWPMLSAYFRDVLLPPQRRAEDAGIAWSWDAASGAAEISAGDLATVRKRLARNQQLLADTLTRSADPSAGRSVDVARLATTMAAVVSALIAKPDAELASYVCRTEAGLRVHSWGASQPGGLVGEAAPAVELRGTVHLAGQPARRGEVRLETIAGEPRARVRIARDGAFCFSPVGAGEYRVHARVGSLQFPAAGLVVSVDDTSPAPLRLETDAPEPRGFAGGLRRGALATAMLALCALAAHAGYRRWNATASRPPPVARSTPADLADVRIHGAPAISPRGSVAPSSQKNTDTFKRLAVAAADTPAAPALTSSTATTARASSTQAANVSAALVEHRPPVVGSPAGLAAARGTPAASPAAAPAAGDSTPLSPEHSGVEPEGSPRSFLAAVSPPAQPSSFADRADVSAPAGAPAVMAIAEGDGKTKPDVTANAALAPSTPALDVPVPASPSPPEPPHFLVAEERTRASPELTLSPHSLQPTTWELALLGDAILPTLPRAVGARDNIAALHATWQAAQRAALPGALREPRMREGLTLIARDADSPPHWRWHSDAGPAPRATTSTDTASIEWTHAPPNGAIRVRLIDARGRTRCEISSDADGAWRVRADASLALARWAAVTVDAATAERIGWRSVSGPTLPAGASQRFDPASGELRVEVPVGREDRGELRSLALFDRASGWALVARSAINASGAPGQIPPARSSAP